MSHTTDITLLLGTLDDQALDGFNLSLKAAGIPLDLRDTPRLSSLQSGINNLPGSKYYTNFLAAACWNNSTAFLPVLVSTFQAFDWASPEDAILIIADEQQDTQVFRPAAHGVAL